MKCPVCPEELRPMERMGIEIDYCPKCRGVWLDRGELDKIIDRSVSSQNTNLNNPQPLPDVHMRAPRSVDDSDHGFHRGSPPKRKESFLSNLFDWD